jgi:hypothetical protein
MKSDRLKAGGFNLGYGNKRRPAARAGFTLLAACGIQIT